MINNCEWKIAEFRLGRGREWVYTLANESTTDGSFDSMRLNERAIDKIMSSVPKSEVIIETTEGIFI